MVISKKKKIMENKKKQLDSRGYKRMQSEILKAKGYSGHIASGRLLKTKI